MSLPSRLFHGRPVVARFDVDLELHAERHHVVYFLVDRLAPVGDR